MSAIDDLPPLRDVIRAHGLSARKALGQHFLLDLNLTAQDRARSRAARRISTVVEVGPGPGGLTRALLAEGARPSSRSSATSVLAGAATRSPRPIPAGSTIVAADALDIRHAAAARRGPALSSPTCPTTSARRF